MNKKILYVVIIAVLVVAGIFAAKQISGENETKATDANVQENNNTNEEDGNEVLNLVENEVENNVEDSTNNQTSQESPEEQAKQIVKNNWGEDDTVYFSYDGIDEDGRYIICVREQSTTKALYWYYVDLETGAFDIK